MTKTDTRAVAQRPSQLTQSKVRELRLANAVKKDVTPEDLIKQNQKVAQVASQKLKNLQAYQIGVASLESGALHEPIEGPENIKKVLVVMPFDKACVGNTVPDNVESVYKKLAQTMAKNKKVDIHIEYLSEEGAKNFEPCLDHDLLIVAGGLDGVTNENDLSENMQELRQFLFTELEDYERLMALFCLGAQSFVQGYKNEEKVQRVTHEEKGHLGIEVIQGRGQFKDKALRVLELHGDDILTEHVPKEIQIVFETIQEEFEKGGAQKVEPGHVQLAVCGTAVLSQGHPEYEVSTFKQIQEIGGGMLSKEEGEVSDTETSAQGDQEVVQKVEHDHELIIVLMMVMLKEHQRARDENHMAILKEREDECVDQFVKNGRLVQMILQSNRFSLKV